jgi:MoxR-like ATPase
LHLRLRLGPIHRALEAAVRRRGREIARLGTAGSERMITVEQAARWLGALNRQLATSRISGERVSLTDEERQQEETLSARAEDVGERLPLAALLRHSELDDFDVEALLMCVAAELDPRYGGLFGFLHDDTARRRPTVGLLTSLTATSLAELPARRRALGRLGRLRRAGILRALAAPLEIDEELILGPQVLGVLLGTEQARFRDPLELPPRDPRLPPEVDAARVARLGEAMRDNEVAVVGVWGPRHAPHEEVVRALAAQQGRRVRRCPALDARHSFDDNRRLLRTVIDEAAALDALVWIETDALTASSDSPLPSLLAEALADSPARACLSGAHPFRPATLLAARPYAELTLPAASYAARRALWSTELPELDAARVADLAARFRLRADDLAAVAVTARTAAALSGNIHSSADYVEGVTAQLVQRRVHHFARVVAPRRGADDLVLPPELHRQVLDVARSFRAWPRVAEEWDLGRVAVGGLKALFTGDPGTGKTLAAEVIAGQLGLPLVKIDLAQIVSKWVGETEKNLEAAFREAEDGNAVLFFDEAEALFGKRGEVRHGTDRYANLEVSYLLQRFEEHQGLVILASNLGDEIDDAFTRRFHVVLNFPRPQPSEREQLWRLALPPSAPLASDVVLSRLSAIDLTGAGIVAAARTAALQAAQADQDRIEASHLVAAIARQFQRESRLLTRTDLGSYAHLLP